MPSSQTLSEADRRLVATWAADCAERVLAAFESAAPADGRPRDAIARARAFARGERDTAGEIRQRFIAGRAARAADAPAAVAAARAAAQAAAVAHMGAHALGAAAYAAKAVGLAAPGQPTAVSDEIAWQLEHMSAQVKAALQQLPPLGADSAGPLGPGLLTSGVLGSTIRTIQGVIGTSPRRGPPDRRVRLRVDLLRGRPLLGETRMFFASLQGGDVPFGHDLAHLAQSGFKRTF